MKLYTEEQVNLTMRLMIEDRLTFKQTLELLTPVEIPSNDEIENNIKKSYKKGWEDAFIFMKEQILNQNKS